MDFWFEFASTYSYPAALRVEQVARGAGVAVNWRPFLLGPIFREQGWSDSPFNIHAAKGRYMWRDLERVCDAVGAKFRRPSTFPRNGVLAARVASWFQAEQWVPEFVRQVYIANFAEDRDIAAASELLAIVGRLDLPSNLLDIAESSEAKAKLRDQTDRARALGIFGAPSFISGNELFWGNDRLEAAVAWAQRHEERSV